MSVALVVSLEVAVMMQIQKLYKQPEDSIWDAIELYAETWADTIATHADALQFGGKPGQAAPLFNQLVQAVAHLAFAPGGVEIFGEKYIALHPEEYGRILQTLSEQQPEVWCMWSSSQQKIDRTI
jgi:hypothetical protein